jgi:hypothetical protein
MPGQCCRRARANGLSARRVRGGTWWHGGSRRRTWRTVLGMSGRTRSGRLGAPASMGAAAEAGCAGASAERIGMATHDVCRDLLHVIPAEVQRPTRPKEVFAWRLVLCVAPEPRAHHQPASHCVGVPARLPLEQCWHQVGRQCRVVAGGAAVSRPPAASCWLKACCCAGGWTQDARGSAGQGREGTCERVLVIGNRLCLSL